MFNFKINISCITTDVAIKKRFKYTLLIQPTQQNYGINFWLLRNRIFSSKWHHKKHKIKAYKRMRNWQQCKGNYEEKRALNFIRYKIINFALVKSYSTFILK